MKYHIAVQVHSHVIHNTIEVSDDEELVSKIVSELNHHIKERDNKKYPRGKPKFIFSWIQVKAAN